jgi:hypothetical protein
MNNKDKKTNKANSEDEGWKTDKDFVRRKVEGAPKGRPPKQRGKIHGKKGQKPVYKSHDGLMPKIRGKKLCPIVAIEEHSFTPPMYYARMFADRMVGYEGAHPMHVEDVLQEMRTTKLLVQDWRLTVAIFRRLSEWGVQDRYGRKFDEGTWNRLCYGARDENIPRHPVFGQLHPRRDPTMVSDYLKAKVNREVIWSRAHDSFKSVREKMNAKKFQMWRKETLKDKVFQGLSEEQLLAMHNKLTEGQSGQFPFQTPEQKSRGKLIPATTEMLGSQDWKAAWVQKETKAVIKKEVPYIRRYDGDVTITIDGYITPSGNFEVTETRTERVCVEWGTLKKKDGTTPFFIAVAGYIPNANRHSKRKQWYSPVRGRWFNMKPHCDVEIDEWLPPHETLGMGQSTTYTEGSQITLGYLFAKAKQDAEKKTAQSKKGKKTKKRKPVTKANRGKPRKGRPKRDDDDNDEGGNAPVAKTP